MKFKLVFLALAVMLVVPATAIAASPSNATLAKQIKLLQRQNAAQSKSIVALQRQNSNLAGTVDRLSSEVDTVTNGVVALQQENEKRKQDIAFGYNLSTCYFVLNDDLSLIIYYGMTGEQLQPLDDKGACAAVGIQRKLPWSSVSPLSLANGAATLQMLSQKAVEHHNHQ